MVGLTLFQQPNGVIKHEDFKYDFFSDVFEARSDKHERTKVVKRPL